MQITMPELKDGEKYAGISLDENGQPNEHVILLPGDVVDMTWDQAMEWADKKGGDLPTHQEMGLLFANLKGKFEKSWYWSSTQYLTDTALCHDFDVGIHGFVHKDIQGRARAVRRLSI